MMTSRVFFPNLNSLRFIAAAIVIVGHIEQFKEWMGLPFRKGYSFIEPKLGVILFFVLSGFLITYLLLSEKKQTGKIRITDFYLRRVLRIWPLYFLIVILTLFVIPHIPFFQLPNLDTSSVFEHFGRVALFSLLILPNVVLTSYGIVPYGNQTWSIGSEEQFYLIWPWLMKYVKNRWVVIISTIVLYHTVRFALNSQTDLNGFWQAFRGFWNTFHVDCMAIGGGFALLHFNGVTKFTKLIYHPFTQLLTYLLLVLFVCVDFRFIVMPLGIINDCFRIFYYQIFALLFVVVIFNLATNSRSLLQLEFGPVNYLGKISYGLYMYHPIAIVLAIKIAFSGGILNNWILYPLSFAFTIAIASLSYHFFESPFMQRKQKFTHIASGN